MKNRTKSLSAQLITAFALVIVLSGALAIIVTYQSGKSDAQLRAQEKLDSVMAYLLGAIELPLWNLDTNTVRYIGESVAQDVTIERIVITDTIGEVLFERNKNNLNSNVSGKADIFHRGKRVGEAQVSVSKAPFEAQFNEYIKLTILALVLEVCGLVVFAGVLLRKLLRKPFSELEQIIAQYSEGDCQPHPRELSYKEFKTTGMVLEDMGAKIVNQIDELQNHQEHLEELVESRTTELSIANERLKELDQLKSMFIASMSHELRTPLNSIIGFTGIVLNGSAGKLEPKQKDFLGRSYRASKHLLALISDVIDIFKVASGEVGAYVETFLLNEVLTEVLDSASSHRKEDVELKTTIPAGIEMYSDRQRVLQCILNLLSNALKYTQEGSVHLSVTEIDGQVEIRVEDTGIGIAEADMEKLFQPFERFDSAMRIPEGGTGLGLYLTRKLTTEILGGSLRAESSLGKGSTFYLTLPKTLKPKDPEIKISSMETTG